MNAPTVRIRNAVACWLLAALAPFGAEAGDFSGNTLTVEFQLAALPQTLPLCNAPIHRWRVDVDGESYSRVDVDGEIYSQFPFPDAYFAITIEGPAPPARPCTPQTMPTQDALRLSVVRVVRGQRMDIPAALSIDFARAVLAVRIDAGLLALADPHVYYLASTDSQPDRVGYLSDFASVRVPVASPDELRTLDARNDVFNAATRQVLSPEGHQSYGLLDIVGMSVSLEPSATAAAPGAIGPAMTGSWMDPAQSGHGLMLQVLESQRLLATWFTFTPDGTQQAWFIGVGTYSGNTATITDVVRPEGGRWIPNFDPARVVMQPWGSLTITFVDCNHGRVQFDSVAGFGSGSMDLTRLTLPAGLTCPVADSQETPR